MIQELIVTRINQLPEVYQKEVLDFSEYLLSKVSRKKIKNVKSNKDYDNVKNDYINSENVTNAEAISLQKAAKLMLNEYLNNPEMAALNILDSEDFYETR